MVKNDGMYSNDTDILGGNNSTPPGEWGEEEDDAVPLPGGPGTASIFKTLLWSFGFHSNDAFNRFEFV